MSENTIQEYPFHLYSSEIFEDSAASKVFFSEHPITLSLLSQVYAYISSLQNFEKTTDGLIDSSKYLRNNFKGDAWHKGLYQFLMTEPRSTILPGGFKQSDPTVANYSGLVPMILAAHKQLNGIPYSAWSLQGLHALVSTDLFVVMNLRGTVPEFSKEELLKIRNAGLTPQSGKSMGVMANPISKYALVGTSKRGIPEKFTKLPKLAQTVLTQIWVAYPTVRTDLMILDLNDWDNMPEPLEDSEVLVPIKQPVKPSKISNDVDLPWDL